MPTNVNTNKNTQNNENRQSVRVVVNNVVPRRRAPRRKAPDVVAPPPSNTNIIGGDVYYPHQSTSVPDHVSQPSYFATATTNRQAYLDSLANNASNEQAQANLRDAYTQASVPQVSQVSQADDDAVPANVAAGVSAIAREGDATPHSVMSDGGKASGSASPMSAISEKQRYYREELMKMRGKGEGNSSDGESGRMLSGSGTHPGTSSSGGSIPPAHHLGSLQHLWSDALVEALHQAHQEPNGHDVNESNHTSASVRHWNDPIMAHEFGKLSLHDHGHGEQSEQHPEPPQAPAEHLRLPSSSEHPPSFKFHPQPDDEEVHEEPAPPPPPKKQKRATRAQNQPQAPPVAVTRLHHKAWDNIPPPDRHETASKQGKNINSRSLRRLARQFNIPYNNRGKYAELYAKVHEHMKGKRRA